jgi:RNA polymerase sigma-70 factor (ECF subfamily)
MTPSAALRPYSSDERWAEYIRRCGQGDETALGNLYDESKSLVYGVGMRVLNDKADAEEVTLDVYTQVWRSAKDYDGSRGSPSAWLVLLARSRAIDRIRARASRSRLEAPLEGDFRAAEGAEETMWMREERARIRKALEKLGPEQRRLVELAFFSGFTHSELAARLNLPLGTVKTRIRAAMGRLKQELTAKERGSDGTA